MKYILPLLMMVASANAEVVREMGDLVRKDNVNSRVGINFPINSNPAATLDVYGDIKASGGITGSLTGAASLNVLKAGDTMTGQLTTASTLTVQGNAFSVGGSTLVVTGGKVGVGTASPLGVFEVRSNTTQTAGPLLIDEPNKIIYLGRLSGTSGDQDILRFRGRTNTTHFAVEPAAAKSYFSEVSVGIGTTDPATKLHMSSGTLTVDGTGAKIQVNGTIGINTSATYADIHSGVNLSGVASYQPGINLASGQQDAFIRFGQGSANYSFWKWDYDSTPANAKAWFGTAGYANPIEIDASRISLQANNTAGFVGIGTTAPASKLQIGTSLNSTTDYMQIDTLEADTAGPPASGDCDAATEVGRMVVSTRYSETADYSLWVCVQTGASSYAWYRSALNAP
jgi:hypothetical protein